MTLNELKQIVDKMYLKYDKNSKIVIKGFSDYSNVNTLSYVEEEFWDEKIKLIVIR